MQSGILRFSLRWRDGKRKSDAVMAVEWLLGNPSNPSSMGDLSSVQTVLLNMISRNPVPTPSRV